MFLRLHAGWKYRHATQPVVTTHGRAEAQRQHILATLANSPDIDLRAAAEQHANLERYTISLWHTAEIEDEF